MVAALALDAVSGGNRLSSQSYGRVFRVQLQIVWLQQPVSPFLSGSSYTWMRECQRNVIDNASVLCRDLSHVHRVDPAAYDGRVFKKRC